MNKLRFSFTLCFLSFFLMYICPALAQKDNNPLRIAVAGVAHGHLNDVTSRIKRGDFKVVGVYEKDDRMRAHNGLSKFVDKSLFYGNLEEMLDKTKPEAVVAYGSIRDHLAVVEACAPRGIHVMVEKPLGMNMKHARRMAKLAKKYHILLLTNYETSWYATNHETYKIINEGEAEGQKSVFIHVSVHSFGLS